MRMRRGHHVGISYTFRTKKNTNDAQAGLKRAQHDLKRRNNHHELLIAEMSRRAGEYSNEFIEAYTNEIRRKSSR